MPTRNSVLKPDRSITYYILLHRFRDVRDVAYYRYSEDGSFPRMKLMGSR